MANYKALLTHTGGVIQKSLEKTGFHNLLTGLSPFAALIAPPLNNGVLKALEKGCDDYFNIAKHIYEFIRNLSVIPCPHGPLEIDGRSRTMDLIGQGLDHMSSSIVALKPSKSADVLQALDKIADSLDRESLLITHSGTYNTIPANRIPKLSVR